MKDFTPIKGRHYIEQLVAQGEHQQQDFKFLISDAHKIARSISAFANRGGGRLLIGVKDNGVLAGVRNDEDVYVVEQAAVCYCNPPQQVDFTTFNVGSGTIVIRASIAQAERRPVFAQDTDRQWKAYYRVNDENILAHPLMVKAWQLRERPSRHDTVFTLSSAESILLEILEGDDVITSSRDIAIRLHQSVAVIDKLVIRLAAMGLIDFEYIGRGNFRFVRV